LHRTDAGDSGEASAAVQMLDTRSRIIEAAGALFRRHGFDRTSTTMLARRLGLTPGALYWHFPSKGAILAAVLEDQLTTGIERARHVVTGTTPGERLRQFVYTDVVGNLASARDTQTNAIWGALYRVLELRDVLPSDDQLKLRKLQRTYVDMLRDILHDGIATREFREHEVTSAAFFILNSCDCVELWYRSDGPLSVHEVGLRYANFAYCVVRASEPGMQDDAAIAGITI
jgi:AcrR family transcriptional regulator